MRLTHYFTALFLLGSLSYGQQYILKNGKTLPSNSVSVSGNNFSGTITGASGVEVVNFTAADIASVSIPTPSEISEAQKAIVTGKPEEAVGLTSTVLKTHAAIKGVEGSPWSEAMLLQLDALEAQRKSSLNSDYSREIKNLPKNLSTPLNDMIAIIESGKKEQDVKTLLEIAKTSDDSFVKARAYLRAADVLLALGKEVEAVKTYLRVPAFYATEKYLSARATFAAARALAQMKREEDWKKLLEDYGNDNFGGDFATQAKVEIEKLTPKKKSTDMQK